MKTIGSNLKKIRELKNISQSFIAEKLGISQSEYSRMETGTVKINADTLSLKIYKVDIELFNNFNDDDLLNKKKK